MNMMVGDRVVVVKGCKPRDLHKGMTFSVESVESMGRDYGYCVRVVLTRQTRRIALFARHMNRLSDARVRLNDGRPEHRVDVELFPSRSAGTCG